MQSTGPLCSKCQQNPVTTSPRIHIDPAEVFNRLRSEYGPSASQTKEVERLLLAAEKDLADYATEILHLQSRIVYMKVRQARMKEHAQRLRHLNSPVRRLPNEILSRVFDYSCESNLLQEFPWSGDDDKPWITMSAPALAYLPAMTISSVCARWRSLAISIPCLWSRMSLELSFASAKLPNASIALSGFISTIELHLFRSGDQPLDLTIDVEGSVEGSGLGGDLLPFNLVRRQCSRWRSFSILGPNHFSKFSTSTNSPLELPLLRELEFEDHASEEDWQWFERATSVRSLTMHDFDISELPSWRNRLTALDVPIDANSVVPVLDELPKLMQLRLWECALYDHAAPVGVPPKRNDTATSLSLVLFAGRRGKILDSLTLPSLVDLKLEVSKYAPRTDAWPTDALVSFLRRSEPSDLTTFAVQSVAITDSDLVAALKFMPSLINLTIDDTPSTETPITSRFINSLHSFTPSALHPNNSTALLPRLRCLKLYFHGASFDDAAFIDMVSSRWLPDAQYASAIGISCLRTVVMSFRTRAVDEKVYQPLHLLDIAGMMTAVISQGRTLML